MLNILLVCCCLDFPPAKFGRRVGGLSLFPIPIDSAQVLYKSKIEWIKANCNPLSQPKINHIFIMLVLAHLWIA